MEEFIDGKLKSFILMQPSEVQRRVAELAAREAAKVLRIPVPAIRFFYRSTWETLNGFTNDEGIFISLGMSDGDVARTVLHECRHVWQRRQPEWRNRDERWRERDAVMFELGWPR